MNMKTILAIFAALSISSQADILITMVVDGDITSEPRFVEIYNSGASSVDLEGFRLARYNNGSASATASNLSGTLNAGSFGYLIATSGGDQATFTNIYGSGHTIIGAAQADGNGNDVYEIRDDPFTVSIDRFGIVGTDGNGQNWEYTDGAFVRNNSNTSPNADFSGVGAGAGAPGAGLSGWTFTDLGGVSSGGFAAALPLGTFSPTVVPEPGTLALLGTAFLGLLAARRRIA